MQHYCIFATLYATLLYYFLFTLFNIEFNICVVSLFIFFLFMF